MSKIELIEDGITQEDILRSLATGLQQLSIEGKNGETYIAMTKQTKGGISVECVDGTKFDIKINSIA